LLFGSDQYKKSNVFFYLQKNLKKSQQKIETLVTIELLEVNKQNSIFCSLMLKALQLQKGIDV